MYVSEQLGASQIFAASIEWGMPLAEVVELARPLAGLGLVMPDLDRLAAMPQPDARQVELLSEGDGAAPFLEQVNVASLLRASAKWGMPLAEVVELARPLAGLGLVVPDLERLAAMPQLSARQMELLSLDLDGAPPFLEQVNLGSLIRASAKWGMPLAEVVELARPLAGLGLVVPDLDRLAAMPQPNARQMELLSWDLGGAPHFLEQMRHGAAPFLDEVNVGSLIRASAKWGMPLAEVVELARPLAGLGLVVPDLERLAAMPQLSARQLELMSRDLDGAPPFLDQVNVGQLMYASAQWGMPLAEVVELARALAGLGLVVPDLDRLAAMPQLDDAKVLRIAANLKGNPSPHRMVMEMLASAEQLSLAEICSFSRDLKDAGLCNVVLPALRTSSDEKLLRLIARTIRWQQAAYRVDPLFVAFVARGAKCQITDLRPALNVLAIFDVDCAEALEFVQFCAESDRIEMPANTVAYGNGSAGSGIYGQM